MYAQGSPGVLGAGYAAFWKVTKRVNPTARIFDVTYLNTQNAALQTIDGDCVLISCDCTNVADYSTKRLQIIVNADAEL